MNSFLEIIREQMKNWRKQWFKVQTQISTDSGRMSDIVDILGIEKEEESIREEKKGKKESKNDPYASLPRYLRDLVGDNNPLPDIAFEKKKSRVCGWWVDYVEIVVSKEPAQKWVYKEFTSSARNDGATFSHWVRRSVEYPDYPFARFNVKINVITYTRRDGKRSW